MVILLCEWFTTVVMEEANTIEAIIHCEDVCVGLYVLCGLAS